MSFFKAYLGSRSDLDKVPLSSGATYWCIDDGTVHMDHEDDNGILHRTQINAGNSDTLDNKTLEEIQKLIDYNDLLNKPTLGTLAAKSTVAKTDLATDVQTSLGKADTAIQSLAGYAKETYVNEQISKIPTPDVSGQIGTHNTSAGAHTDIRKEVSDLATEVAYINTSGDAVSDVASLQDQLRTYLRQELQTAKDSGEFDGQSAYAFAQEGGFTGTRGEFISRLIQVLGFDIRIDTITISANKWTGSGNLYSQVVDIDGITENSQVDLTPSVAQLATFYEKDLTFVTENDGGLVTVYAIGQKPQNDYTIQVTITEVA